MNSNQIANVLYDTVEMIVNKKVAEAGFDKTIKAQIISCIDATKGEYKVQYQDSHFTATAINTDIKYSSGQTVYILIPNNDWEQDKKILNAVNQLGTQSISQTQYQKIGQSCYQGSLSLCSYKTGIKEIILDTNKIELIKNHIQNNRFLVCSSIVITQLDKVQQVKGNYGLKLIFEYGTNKTESYICSFDIDDMVGTPYSFIIPTKQEKVFQIDKEVLVGLTNIKIELFTENFPNQDSSKPDDIFFNNLEIFGAMVVKEAKPLDQYLLITNDQDFTFVEQDGKLTLKAEAYIKGEKVNSNSQPLTYYWFRENSFIDSTNVDYVNYGGKGWQCINPYTVIEGTDEAPIKKNWITNSSLITLNENDYPLKETKIKCVVIYGKVNLIAEIKITNKNEYNYDIIIKSSNGNEFNFDVNSGTLTCTIKENDQYITNFDNYEFQWTREDINNSKVILDSKTHVYTIDFTPLRQIATFKCGVKKGQIHIGTASITLTNTSDIQYSYTLKLENKDQVFKYNANGVSPTSSINPVPQSIKPLDFKLYDPTGKEIDKSKISAEWSVPENNTFIRDWNEENRTFTIAPTYSPTYTDNVITLIVTYDSYVLEENTNFLFLKDGESGTNGTDFVCRIVPAYHIKPNEYPMITIVDNKLKMNYNNNEDILPTFTVQLYEGSKEVINIDGNIEWSIWSNTEIPLYTITFSGNSCTLAALNGEFNVEKAAVLKVKVVHKNKIYYSAFPLITCNGSETLKLKYGTGYQEVLYNSAGKDPVCKGSAIFEVEGDEGMWNTSTEQLTIEETNGNSASIIPIDEIDGLIMNNNIYYTVENATLLIPVHMILNRFGLVNINEWDGSSIKISDNEYILSPQVGAGVKDVQTNKFTGLLMGKVKSGTETEVGLFGYSNGLRSIFLDAETGIAIFGTAGAGQIILDPLAGGIIEGGAYSEGNKTGMRINLSKPSIKWGNGNFQVDTDGNVTLNGNIKWGANASPTQIVYAQEQITKPANSTPWSSFDEESETDWHRKKSDKDIWGSYTYDGGSTWTSPIQIVGQDGSSEHTLYLYCLAKDNWTVVKPIIDEKPTENNMPYVIYQINGESFTADFTWSYQPLSFTDDYPIVYRMENIVENEKYDKNKWTDPVKWAEKGSDGKSAAVVYLYCLSDGTNSQPPNPPEWDGTGNPPTATWPESLNDNKWTLNPSGTSEKNIYEFVSQQIVVDDVYKIDGWSTPVIWSIHPLDGKPSSAATVAMLNVFNALTNGGTENGVFVWENETKSKVLINAEYIRSTIIESELVLSNHVIAQDIDAIGGTIGGLTLNSSMLLSDNYIDKNGYLITNNTISGLLSAKTEFEQDVIEEDTDAIISCIVKISKPSLITIGEQSPIRFFAGWRPEITGTEDKDDKTYGVVPIANNAPFCVLEDGSVYANAIRIAGNSVIEEGVKIYGTLVTNELVGFEGENNAKAGIQYISSTGAYRIYNQESTDAAKTTYITLASSGGGVTINCYSSILSIAQSVTSITSPSIKFTTISSTLLADTSSADLMGENGIWYYQGYELVTKNTVFDKIYLKGGLGGASIYEITVNMAGSVVATLIQE